MSRRGVDWPSLQMVLVYTANIVVSSWDTTGLIDLKRLGGDLVVVGALLFAYAVAYLRSGFFGETEPKLDHLVTEGPYRLCRHPLYLSFIVLALGLDLVFGSILGVAFTVFLSIPSAVYRARVEDRLLREKFGEVWEDYAERVGFLLPKLPRKGKESSSEEK
ncbi:MAG: isoprenylcysteine carboxylmethyltransferase family protein [Candidatus Bathyarchaeota archaeon]|nr:isoprenylcysteine carboxylmethyltransferase family protein [Candidatus Bathyarchaeota archaeon]